MSPKVRKICPWELIGQNLRPDFPLQEKGNQHVGHVRHGSRLFPHSDSLNSHSSLYHLLEWTPKGGMERERSNQVKEEVRSGFGDCFSFAQKVEDKIKALGERTKTLIPIPSVHPPIHVLFTWQDKSHEHGNLWAWWLWAHSARLESGPQWPIKNPNFPMSLGQLLSLQTSAV